MYIQDPSLPNILARVTSKIDRSQIDRWISRVGLHLLRDTCGDGRRAGRGSFIIHSSMLVIDWLLLEGFSHWNVNEPWHERDELPEVYRKTPEVADEWAINLPKIPRNCQKLCRIVWVRNIFTRTFDREVLFPSHQPAGFQSLLAKPWHRRFSK